MRKSLLLACLALLLGVSGCSSGGSASNNDKALLKNYFANYYSSPFVMDDLKYYASDWQMVTNYDIAGLKEWYNVNYSYSCPSGKITISNSKSSVLLEISSSILGKEFMDIPVNVTVEVEKAFAATYTMTCRYKPYTGYFAELLLTNRTYKKGYYKTKGEATITWQYITSGHYYHDRTFSADFDQEMCTYYVKKYEKMTGAPYNIEEFSIYYYFGDGNPRIEGLSTGTFYIDGSTYTSENTEDVNSYYWFQYANDVFKQYGDTRYIAQIS